MTTLLDSPSSGKSEVLTTLHREGRSIPFRRLCQRVEWDMGGVDDDTLDSFRTTVSTILSALQTAGYVTATTADGSAAVDLTAGVPADTTRVRLTLTGRTYSRHPRPRPIRDPMGGH